mgnify:FL=1
MIDWLEPALRFVQYVLLLGLFGWSAFRVVGLRAATWVPEGSGRTTAILAAALAPVVSTMLMLAAISAMMGQPLAALDASMIQAMTLSTDMGWAFMVRTALLLAGLVAIFLARKVTGSTAAAFCFGAALMTLGWSGHAAATEGALGSLHRISNGVHLLAAGLWLGAIGWFLHLTIEAHREPGHVSAMPLLTIMHRFAPLGVALVATVAATGLLNAQLIFGLENSPVTLTTTYGLLLAVKIAAVAAMLAFGAHNARLSRQMVSANVAADPTEDAASAEDIEPIEAAALPALRRSLTMELSLALVVIGLVAVFGMLSPMLMT